jgi:GNAT superfamily N-acetyltransferase
MTEPFAIRPMIRAEVDRVIDWAAAEGWNPGLADAECFYPTDRAGFLLGLWEDEPVAAISVVRYDDHFAFLGFYIVVPEMRGRGLGWRIWQAGLAYAGDRTIGLDGVVAQQDNYRASGFELAHRNIRYGGRAPSETSGAGAHLIDPSRLQVEQVIAYDKAFFPAPRERFIECWLQPARRTAKILVQDGDIAGYGVIRQCREGYKIGPIFADDEAEADLLFRGLTEACPGEMVFLDPPEPNRPAVALAERYGLEPVFETARMYRGAVPELPLEKIFGITTFELG